MNRREFFRISAIAGAGLGAGTFPRSLAATAPLAAPPFPKIAGLTRRVAEFVSAAQYKDLPAEVVELGKKSILDGIGLAIASGNSKGCKKIQGYLGSLGLGGAGASVMGTSLRFPARFAALANGVSIHMEDFDDTQLAVAKDRVYGLLTHPTVAVLPTVLAGSEKEGMSGPEFMLNYHVGVEVECKLAEACSPRSYGDGFHSTGVFGVFGSAAACAKARNYDVAAIARTFAVAATHAGGLRENFGTLSKSLQAGQAAEAGIVAADLVAAGWDGAETILEANNGFFHAYGGTYDPEALMEKLGRPWTFATPGISIKPHPSGSLTHPGMTEMLRLIRSEGIRPEQVEKVDVGTNGKNLSTLIHHRPKNGLQAKFSMEFCLAVLLVEGRAGLAEFDDAAVVRPAIRQMVERVNFYADPEADAAGFDKMTTILRIHLKDGRVVSGRADFGKGSPSDPMSYEEVAEKFRGCAEFASWPGKKAERIVETVRTLEQCSDVRLLIPLITA
ncbi:MAG: MmgE/PrpD family protein [Verrucomicrobia bacterium]|nr:MmgE/PrpD family protein [Verrucomicrobiota bacterium]